MSLRRFPLGRLGSIRNDQSGATIIEFAIIAPVLIAFFMFLFDAGFNLYARAILSGEVNAAGRASTLETASQTVLDDLDGFVAGQVRKLIPHGQISFERVAYNNYGIAQSKAEPFVDTNQNGICDNGETFVDYNFNGQHDADAGRAGGGGARDVAVYTVTVRYPRIFPIDKLIGLDPNVEISATTLLRNQPFDSQTVPPTGTCP